MSYIIPNNVTLDNLSASSTISASFVYGDGRYLTNIPVAAGTTFTDGNIIGDGTAGNKIRTTTNITASSFTASVGFSGSLIGTASYALDSNLLDGQDSTVFAKKGSTNTFTADQVITGTLVINNQANLQRGLTILGGSNNFSGGILLRKPSPFSEWDIGIQEETGWFNQTSPNSIYDQGTLVFSNGSGRFAIALNGNISMGAGYKPQGTFLLDVSGSTRITSDLSVSGNITIPTSKGIIFNNGSFDGSADTTLNDYELGTWTPSVTGALSVATNNDITPNVSGRYIKIGRFVQLRWWVGYPSEAFYFIGSSTITGVPFQPFLQNAQVTAHGYPNYSSDYADDPLITFVGTCMQNNNIIYLPNAGGTSCRMFVFECSYTVG